MPRQLGPFVVILTVLGAMRRVVLPISALTLLVAACGGGSQGEKAAITAAPFPAPLVVAVGDSLVGTATWVEEYAVAVGDDLGLKIRVRKVWLPGDPDLSELVARNGKSVAAAKLVFIEADPGPVFGTCGSFRDCRAQELDAYGPAIGTVLDDVLTLRAGDASGVRVVALGAWGGDAANGLDFYGTEAWLETIEDMQAWASVVREEAAVRKIAVIDVNAQLLGEDYRRRMPQDLTTDGMHFSAEGRTAVARILLEHEERFDWSPTG